MGRGPLTRDSPDGLSAGGGCRRLGSLVFRSGSTPHTGPVAARRARRVFRALCLPLLVVAASLPLGTALRPAGAATVGDLQSQAATVAQRLVLEQLQDDSALQATSVASARVTADDQAIAQIQHQLTVDQQAIDQHLHVIQNQAIQSYINSGADSSSSDTTLFDGGTTQAQEASEYASLAVGDITTQMDQLHTAQRQLQAQQATLQARQSQGPGRPGPSVGRPGPGPGRHRRPPGPEGPGDRTAGRRRGGPAGRPGPGGGGRGGPCAQGHPSDHHDRHHRHHLLGLGRRCAGGGHLAGPTGGILRVPPPTAIPIRACRTRPSMRS